MIRRIKMKVFWPEAIYSILFLFLVAQFYIAPMFVQSLIYPVTSRIMFLNSNLNRLSQQAKRCSVHLNAYNRNKGSSIISSTSNSRVKLLRALESKKKERDTSGQIFLEGHRQIIDAIKNGLKPAIILYTARAMTAPLGAELSDVIYGKEMVDNWEVEETTDSVMKSLTDTVSNQGVVAAFFKASPLISIRDAIQPFDSSLGTSKADTSDSTTATSVTTINPLILLLDNVADPGNMGTLIRSAYGLGVDAMLLVGGCDPWSPKVLRASMGTCLQLPLLELADWKAAGECLAEAVEDGVLDAAALQVVIADAASDQKQSPLQYQQIDFTLPTVLVVGSEAAGVSKDAYHLPAGNTVQAMIPMVRRLDSFNAAVAGSILVAEAARQRLSSINY